MTRETLVNGFNTVKREGFAELGEGLYLQTFKSIKQEHWFGTEMDNWDWRGCEDDDIFILTETGDVVEVDSVAELLKEVEHENDPVKAYRLWAEKEADSWTQTFATLEEAINEADWLWKHERYKNIKVSTEECLDEDGCPSDHNIVWEDGDWTGEWADEL